MPASSPARLLILGMLSNGPMHGHQIRREAELRDVQEWAGITSGSLYGVMHRLEGENLIEPVRTEREGNRPARTVYRITDEGTKELGILLEQALQVASLDLGVFDVALLVAENSMPTADVLALVGRRSARIQSMLDNLDHDRDRLVEAGHLGRIEALLMRHAELKLAAELSWHDEVAAVFAPPRPRLIQGE